MKITYANCFLSEIPAGRSISYHVGRALPRARKRPQRLAIVTAIEREVSRQRLCGDSSGPVHEDTCERSAGLGGIPPRHDPGHEAGGRHPIGAPNRSAKLAEHQP
jgi:hypothetical protein